MGYRNTPAHMTKSLARHGGDIAWPADPGLIIRRGNVDRTSDLPGGDLGWVEAIGPMIQALSAVGQTAYSLRQGQMDAKRERTKAADAEAAAAHEADAARKAAAAATAQVAAQAGTVAIAGSRISTSALVLGGAVAAGALYLFMRRK